MYMQTKHIPPIRPGVWLIISVALLALMILSGVAAAQEVNVACGTVEQILGVLEQEYGESLQSQAVIDGIEYALWGNRSTGTWSLLMYPDGATVCLIDEGEMFGDSIAI